MQGNEPGEVTCDVCGRDCTNDGGGTEDGIDMCRICLEGKAPPTSETGAS